MVIYKLLDGVGLGLEGCHVDKRHRAGLVHWLERRGRRSRRSGFGILLRHGRVAGQNRGRIKKRKET